ncbi:ATP-binding protein [Methylobacterium sp. J-068]|uniref:ATP-binding protein n=1 Tax=Methylobacterium sp. J-068 TaxID=2836649 RepID=UPI001FB9891F|nr:ATP-binding protein [Methylobacterium sp. J-068]MCJ2035960.1 ATP-binding protein [Methylobacterium sp. J-068]
MSDRPTPVGDPIRLATLDAYDLLDTPPEQGFDDVVRLATRLCAAPVALISLVAADRQWFKARVGFPLCETDLDRSVCQFVLSEPGLLVIPDLGVDPRTAANPLVTGPPHIRFYAGAPLRTPEGQTLGSLCVIDTVPRPEGLTAAQADDLRALARQVCALMEMRRAVDRREVARMEQRGVMRERESRDALAHSEARFRTLFETIDEGFCIIEFIDGPHGPSSDYVHVLANQGYERQTGIPDVVGKTLRDIAPGEAEGWLELYGGVLRTGKSIRFERAFPEVGRHIEVSAARIEPASRRQVSVLFRDISARKRADAALRASEASARENAGRVQLALAAGAIVGTWHWDIPADRFTADEGFARSFGLDPERVRLGLGLEQVVATVHPDDREALNQAIAEAVTRGGAYSHQYRVRRVDGRYYWVEASGRADHAEDGTPTTFPGVLIDIEERIAVQTERDRAAAALAALNETLEQRVAERTDELMSAQEALRQSQKMEAVGQLTGGLAHDFNNLLAGISGSLELMQTRMSQGRFSDLERYMTVAQGAAKRAAALTHRLLAFSRRQTLTPKPTNVNRLIAGMEELIRRTIGPEIAMEMVGAAGLWPALVDPGQLENALLNLCINARDAMPEGGRITIETANKWLDRPAAIKHDVPEGQYLSLCVSDTGTGMPPEVVARVFEPFFTTKPLGQGTGLGLSMIHGFTQQSGGQVRIYSEVGAGTTVCLYLPRHYGDVEVDDVALTLTEVARAQQGETVLIVDDEPSVRMLVTEVLEDLGYTAIEAADSVAGLKVLQSDVRIDLLVTDVGLPGGMNGRQMADAGRVGRPDLKVLFVTGYAENAILGHGHLEPGMEVLTKPFPMEALASRIKDLITAR